MIRRLLSGTLAAILAAGIAPVVLAQQGTVSGRAGGTARKPYDNYTVRLVDFSNRQIAATVPLDQQAQFAFTGVQVDKQYLVQLFDLRANRIVCTEGPYPLIAPDQISKTDVNIKCGKLAALWVLPAVAAAGTAAAVTLQSGSR
jgi:hypothetical protein